jgi:hypothetical protein
MNEHNAIVKKITSLYIHLVALGLHGFLMSEQIHKFCKHHDIDVIWVSVFKQVRVEYMHRPGVKKVTPKKIPEEWLDHLFKEFLIEIYKKKPEKFDVIIVSFLTFYSKFTDFSSEGRLSALDSGVLTTIEQDLIGLGYPAKDVDQLFLTAGCDLSETRNS